MSENPTKQLIDIEPISTSSEFAEKLISKNIPTNPERAREVGQMLFDAGATPELVGKIGSCFRFIDKEEFETDIETLANQITKDFSDKPYNLILSGRRRKSSDWMLDQLKSYNIPKPVIELKVNELWGKLHNLKRPSIFIDEWAFSGEQISDAGERIRGAAKYGEDGSGLGFKPEVHAYMLYAQTKSKRAIEESDAVVHIINPKPITNLFEAITPNEREILRKVKIDERARLKQDVHIRPSTTLTFGWWKIPDAFYELFVSPSPLSLVDVEDFWPPYKDKSLLNRSGTHGRLYTPF